MRTFVDASGRTWTIAINVAQVKRVRDALKIDLLDLDKDLALELINDPVKLVDVIYVLCRDQALSATVSDEDFGRGMAGDAIDGATRALLEELADFFPNPRHRHNLKLVLAATFETIDAAAETARSHLEEGGELARLRDKALAAVAEAFGPSSGNSPASAAGASPGPSP